MLTMRGLERTSPRFRDVSAGERADNRFMRTIRILILAVIPAALMVLSPVRAEEAAEGQRTVTKTYVAGDAGPWPGAGICGDLVGGHNIGAVCFGRIDGDVITLKIEDDSGLPVGGLAYFTGADHNYRYQQRFCGESTPFPNIGGSLSVSLDAPGEYSPGCPLQGALFATTGRVRTTFTTTRT